jgi:hypothetical protein
MKADYRIINWKRCPGNSYGFCVGGWVGWGGGQ